MTHVEPSAGPRSGWVDGATCIILSIAIVALCWHRVGTFDAWTDLALGNWIIDHRSIPAQDPFLFWEGARTPANMWMSRVLFALTERLASFPLLTLLKTTVVWSAFALVFLRTRRLIGRATVLIAPIMLWGIILASVRFQMRGEIFGLLCLSLALFFITRAQVSRRVPWELIPVQIIWANLHASFPLGPAIVLCWIFARIGERHLLERRFEGNAPRTGGLLLLTALLVGASALHPDGLANLLHPIGQQAGALFHHHISEWLPPFASAFGTPTMRVAVAVFLILVAVATAATVRRGGLFPLAIAALFSFLLLSASRHIALFAVATLPIAAQGLDELIRPLAQHNRFIRMGRIAAATACGIGLLLILNGSVASAWGSHCAPGAGPEESHLPQSAATFIAEHPIDGHLFNSYDIGGYLSWRLGPNRQLLIDGRNMAYGSAFYRRYLQACFSPQHNWDFLSDDLDLRAAFLSVQAKDAAPLIGFLSAHEEWVPIWVDGRAVIFIKQGMGNDALINAFRVDVDDPAFLEANEGLDAQAVCERGDALFFMHAFASAETLFNRARWMDASACPRAFELAHMARTRGDTAEYTSWLARAEQEHPDAPPVQFERGLLLDEAGDDLDAIRHYKRAVHLGSRNPALFNNLGRLYLERRQWKKARPHLERALTLDPNFAPALRNLGIVHRHAGDIRSAARAWRRYLEIRPDAPEAETIREEVTRMMKRK